MPALVRGNMCRQLHGVAAKDNNGEDRYLYVYSEELLPFHQGIEGKLDGMTIDSQIQTTGNGGDYQSQVKTTNCLRCVYRDESSSGTTPPLVRKGEQVLIYNFGDSDVWYWKSEGRNENNRKTDLWRKEISGTCQAAPVLDDNNTYFIEMDTRTTHRIRISTSNQDGELHRYLFMIDADASKVFLGDDVDNQILIESEVPRVAMRNKDESLIDLNTENIVIACKGDYTVKAEGNINTLSGKDTKFESSGSLTTKSANDTVNESGAQLQQKAASNWSLDFKGGGNMNSGGGTVQMQVGHFSVKKG